MGRVGSLVKERYAEDVWEMSDESPVKGARIVVIGVGGAGNNTITHLMEMGIQGAECIAVNTDRVQLDVTKAHAKILIGENITKGLGAGGYPEVGRAAAEESKDKLADVVRDAELVFIAAGLGGGTGTGAAPVIAELAKSYGAIVIGVVTMPFRMERARIDKAREGLRRLRKHCDTVVVIENDKLLELAPDLPIEDAFMLADEILAHMVKGISETIALPSLINLDFADVRTIMANGGVAMVGIGEGEGENRAEEAVKQALSCPLLDVDIKGATGALIHITGGPDLTLAEANRIGELVTENMDPSALVIWGARIDETLGGMVRVMLLITGVKSSHILGPPDREDEPWYQRAVARNPMSVIKKPKSKSRNYLTELGLDSIF